MAPPVSESDISLEERFQLSDKIKKLNNEGISAIVDFLKKNYENVLLKVDKDKLRIQIDKINKKAYNDIFEIWKTYSQKTQNKVYSSSRKDSKREENGVLRSEEKSGIMSSLSPQGRNIFLESNGKSESNSNLKEEIKDQI